MMDLGQEKDRERIASAVIVAALHALLGYAFITGLGINVPEKVSEQLKLFDVQAEPPPPPRDKPRPARAKAPRREGAASPPNRKSQATPVVAPPPEVHLPVPPPVIASPTPRLGYDPSAGAALVPGPGTGSGGRGNGTGSGDYGDGPGGGGEGGTPPRWRSGRIKYSDYPGELYSAQIGGTVSVAYSVETDGRVSHCEVTHSSGNFQLDELTCSLIERRFRFRPSLDADGHPVRSTIVEDQMWTPHPNDQSEETDP